MMTSFGHGSCFCWLIRSPYNSIITKGIFLLSILLGIGSLVFDISSITTLSWDIVVIDDGQQQSRNYTTTTNPATIIHDTNTDVIPLSRNKNDSSTVMIQQHPIQSSQNTNNANANNQWNSSSTSSASQPPPTSSSSSSSSLDWKSFLQQTAYSLARPFPDRSNQTGWKKYHQYQQQQHGSSSSSSSWKKKDWPTGRKSYYLTTKQQQQQQQQQHAGILFVKIPKAASSTGAAIALQIAHTYNKIQLKFQHKHASLMIPSYRNRNYNDSILFTTVRNPTSRTLSDIQYHHVTTSNNRKKKKKKSSSSPSSSSPLTETQVLNTIQRMNFQGKGGLQLLYTSLDPIPEYSLWSGPIYHWNDTIPQQIPIISTTTTTNHNDNVTTTTLSSSTSKISIPIPINNITSSTSIIQVIQNSIPIVQTIMNQYDFILIAERWQESIVAMALVLGLTTTQTSSSSSSSSFTTNDFNFQSIIVLPDSNKVAGKSYVINTRQPNKCLPLVKNPILSSSSTSSFVYNYLQSEDWKSKIGGDLLLYTVMNISLDLTIDTIIGRNRFNSALVQYQRVEQQIKDKCGSSSSRSTEQYCNPITGIKSKNSTCYYLDIGCGYQCINNEF